MPDIAVVFLVDASGRVLLQHRDELAPRAANQWGMVGGHVEPGEDFDGAVLRELLEETGVVSDHEVVRLWLSDDFTYSDGLHNHYEVYAGKVDLTDEDIVVGEGRAIVFVDPAATRGLDLAESTAHFLPLFLGSDRYRELAGKPRPRRIEVPGHGAEDVLVDEEGFVWTGTDDGSVFRISPEGSLVRIGNTGGRPLGLELLDAEHILVCDADKGLLAMSRTTGVVRRLATEVDGERILVCNNAAVASNGDVWFSDSSRVHPLQRWRADLVEDTRTGRLLCRRADGRVEVHLTGLAFANGVELAADESFVCVAETGARCVVRLWLDGPRAGTRDFLVDELPGHPDNIARGSDGLIWVTIASPKDPVLTLLQDRAPRALRRAAGRLPSRLQPSPQQTVRVQAYDDRGSLVHDIEGDASEYHMVTGVREHDGDVWLGSVEEPAIAVLEGVAT